MVVFVGVVEVVSGLGSVGVVEVAAVVGSGSDSGCDVVR